MWIPERVTKAGSVVPAFQVDECFADDVKKHTWFYCCKGRRYLQTSIKRKTVTLHRFIWRLSGRDDCGVIDHVDGNKFNNTLENLRPATDVLNAANKHRRKKTVLNLPKGVYRKNGRFGSQLQHRKHKVHLGMYDTAEEASAVYQNAKEILIEFANLPGYENVLTGGIDR